MSTDIEDIEYTKLPSKLPELEDVDFDDYNLEDILEKERQLDADGQLGDYDDLDSIHRQIQAARIALYRVTIQLNENDRMLTIANIKYKRMYNRIYMDTNGPSTVRSSYAEIKTESLNNEVSRFADKAKELSRKANFLRDELNILMTLSNDYRQMMKVRQ